MNNTGMTALVDTGCTTTLINSRLMSGCGRCGTVKAVDGRDLKCKGARQVEIKVCGVRVKVEAILMNRIIDGIDVIIGMDVINVMGGVTIKKAEVKFGDVHCAIAAHRLNVCKIADEDLANFNGEKWTVKWKWKGEPPVLQNRVKFYKNSLESEKNSEFEEEVERWIADGILLPCKGKGKGVLPLMAVFQATKKKVRPVLDFRELNHFVVCHTGSDMIDVCNEKMRKWRWLEGGTVIVDLKSACYIVIYIIIQHHDTISKTDARIKDAVTKMQEGRHRKTSLEKYSPLTLLQGFERVVQGLHVRGCWRPNINFIF